MAKSKILMDCMPPQDIMDKIASFAVFQKPSNTLPSKRKSIEFFIYITSRISLKTFHGVEGFCMFCGFSKKWTVGQIRIHFTKENGGTHSCMPSSPARDHSVL
jgi:hypothetical protein